MIRCAGLWRWIDTENRIRPVYLLSWPDEESSLRQISSDLPQQRDLGVHDVTHWYREGALDGHLGGFNLGRVLVVPHMMGCDDVARGAGRFDLDQLEKEDLGVDPLRDRAL